MGSTMVIGEYWENTLNPMRYIYKCRNSYIVQKVINKKQTYFGSYSTLEEAKKSRDHFERTGWVEPKFDRSMRFITKRGEQSYRIDRKVQGSAETYYGNYRTLEYAQYVRDCLEACDWDKNELPRIKKEYPIYYTESLRFFESIQYNPESIRPWKVNIPIPGNRLDTVGSYSRLEDALWERDLTLEYGDDYQSFAEDTRPNPYEDNIPYYWLTRRPRGGTRKRNNFKEEIQEYSEIIKFGITNQEEAADYLGMSSVTIRNHLKKWSTTWDEFKRIVLSGEDPLEVLDPPAPKIIQPDLSWHRSKNDYVHYNTQHKKWVVQREFGGKGVYYGSYDSEKLAKKVVTRLNKCDWDKNELKKIRSDLGCSSVVMSKRWVYKNTNQESWSVRHKNKDKVMINFGTYRDKRVAELVRDNLIQVNWDKEYYPVIREWAEYDIRMIDNCWKCKL